jgi:hypothetical protein
MLFVLASVAHAGCGPEGCPRPEPSTDAMMEAQRPVPAIDRERPEHVEVATFALG